MNPFYTRRFHDDQFNIKKYVFFVSKSTIRLHHSTRFLVTTPEESKSPFKFNQNAPKVFWHLFYTFNSVWYLYKPSVKPNFVHQQNQFDACLMSSALKYVSQFRLLLLATRSLTLSSIVNQPLRMELISRPPLATAAFVFTIIIIGLGCSYTYKPLFNEVSDDVAFISRQVVPLHFQLLLFAVSLRFMYSTTN